MQTPTSASRRESPAISLRPTTVEDLPALFAMEIDQVACDMAGIKPRARDMFFAAWERHLTNPAINSRVILIGREVVGGISRFEAEGRDCIGYGIARAHWGKGIASRALELFLREETRRPLHATIVCANASSRRILEKCGFRCTGYRMGEDTDRYVAGEIADFVLEK